MEKKASTISLPEAGIPITIFEGPLKKIRITCPNCSASYAVPSDLVPYGGREVQCANCDHSWYFRNDVGDRPMPAIIGLPYQSDPVEEASNEEFSDEDGSNRKPRDNCPPDLLTTAEIRMIVEGQDDAIRDFAHSGRLHATDPKGDTALHLAARTANLALCDLLVHAGADPEVLNFERQTPADVAFAEGHEVAAQFLSALVTGPSESENVELINEQDSHETAGTKNEAVSIDRASLAERSDFDKGTEETPPSAAAPAYNASGAAQKEIPFGSTTPEDLDDIFSFEAEKEPEDFHSQTDRTSAAGTFVALFNRSSAGIDDQEIHWELDITPAQIGGEGIGPAAQTAPVQGAEHDFLKVRNRGRQSFKRAVVQTGTSLSVDSEICMTWAEDVIGKGWCSFDDIETLISVCEGNGDPVELHTNLQRNLEAAGLVCFEQSFPEDRALWDSRSDVSSDELAEAVESALNRATRLPGTRRFAMYKSDEMQLLDSMVRAKQELKLGILGCELAVEMILDVFESIRDGCRNPGTVSLRSIMPGRPGHTETAKVMAAAEQLRSWQANGRVMDGKRRREALAALEALDLSLSYYKELIGSLEENTTADGYTSSLDGKVSAVEAATKHLIEQHLPYARRFSARNVEDGEDPEDVFQVAYMGLQRSTRRFDPERGIRFGIYCSFWMMQMLKRWRADQGSLIRVPVHQHEKMAKLESALETRDLLFDGVVSDSDLAVDLEWTAAEVQMLRRIPREAEYPDSVAEWDGILPEPEEEYAFDQAETESIVTDALAGLNERQAEVIRMRFGIGRDTEMTLEEIGQLYGVTRERIRQIEAKGLETLSHPGRLRRLQEMLGK